MTHTLLSRALGEGCAAGVLHRDHPLDVADGREPPRHQVGERDAHHPVGRPRAVVEQGLQRAGRPSEPRHAAAFGEQRAAELAPPVVELAEHGVTTDVRAVEPQRGERPPVRVSVALDGDAGRRHVDEEHREAALALRRRIGARDRAAPVGLVRAGDEHLLAVEHEGAVVLRGGRRLDVRQVAAGVPPPCRRCTRSPCPAHAARTTVSRCCGGAERRDGRRHEHRRGVDERRIVVRRFVAERGLPTRRTSSHRRGRPAGSRRGTRPRPPLGRPVALERLVPARQVGEVRALRPASASARNPRTSARNDSTSGSSVRPGSPRHGRPVSCRAAGRARAGRRGCAGSRWCRRRWW